MSYIYNEAAPDDDSLSLESLVAVLFPDSRPVTIIMPLTLVFGAEGAARHLTQNGPLVALLGMTPDGYSRFVCGLAEQLRIADLGNQGFVSAIRQLLLVSTGTNARLIRPKAAAEVIDEEWAEYTAWATGKIGVFGEARAVELIGELNRPPDKWLISREIMEEAILAADAAMSPRFYTASCNGFAAEFMKQVLLQIGIEVEVEEWESRPAVE